MCIKSNKIIQSWLLIIIFIAPFITKVVHTHKHIAQISHSYNIDSKSKHSCHSCPICKFHSYTFYVDKIQYYNIISELIRSLYLEFYNTNNSRFKHKNHRYLRAPPINIFNKKII